MKDLHTHYYMK